MSIKRKPRDAKRPKDMHEKPIENQDSRVERYKITYMRNPKKAKSTRWERSYITAIFAVVFLLVAIWHLFSSSK